MFALLAPYLLRIGGIAALLLTTWLHGCHYGEQRISDEYAQYRISVESAGRIAQMNSDAIKARDEQRKAASDESYAKALTVLGGDIERLRKSRADTHYLPPVSTDTRCPETWACFDRALLESAIGQLDADVSGIAETGDKMKLRMDEAIRWANRLN